MRCFALSASSRCILTSASARSRMSCARKEPRGIGMVSRVLLGTPHPKARDPNASRMRDTCTTHTSLSTPPCGAVGLARDGCSTAVVMAWCHSCRSITPSLLVSSRSKTPDFSEGGIGSKERSCWGRSMGLCLFIANKTSRSMSRCVVGVDPWGYASLVS